MNKHFCIYADNEEQAKAFMRDFRLRQKECLVIASTMSEEERWRRLDTAKLEAATMLVLQAWDPVHPNEHRDDAVSKIANHRRYLKRKLYGGR